MTDERSRREARAAARRRRVRRRRAALGGVLILLFVVPGVVYALTRGAGPSVGGEPVHPATASSATTSVAVVDVATPAASPAPSPPPLRKPTKKRPLRVYFGGDSLSGMPGIMFAQRARSSRLMSVLVDYQVSSRLTVPDPVNWPARLRAQVDAHRFDVGIFLIGINDPGMPMLADGASTSYPKKAWLAEYQDRVEKMMRTMLQAGVGRVYWVGLPPMPTGGQNQAVKRLNKLFEAAAAEHPDVVYVDTYGPLATKSGAFNPSLRSGDGVHFTNEGATRIATAVWQAMKHDWTASQTPTSVP